MGAQGSRTQSCERPLRCIMMSAEPVEQLSTVADPDQSHERQCSEQDLEAGNPDMEEAPDSVSIDKSSQDKQAEAVKAAVTNTAEHSTLLSIDHYWMGFASACAAYTVWSAVMHVALPGKQARHLCLSGRGLDATAYFTVEQEFLVMFQASANLILPLLAWGFMGLAWMRFKCDYTD